MPTNSDATAFSNQRKIDRCQNGVIWIMWKDGSGSSASMRFVYSDDQGATWHVDAAGIAMGGTNYEGNGSFFIDIDDHAHVVLKRNDTGQLYYYRGTPNTSRTTWTWSAAQNLHAGVTNNNYPDLVAHREGTGWVAHVVWSYADNSPQNEPMYQRVTITSGGAFSLSSVVNIGVDYNVSSVHVYPSIDFNHTGDGKTVAGGTPHLYAAWSAGSTGAGKGIRFKKATYAAGPTWTWGTEREVDSTHYVINESYWLNCLFDGTRVVIGGMLYDGTNRDVKLYDRDPADSAAANTASRTLIDNATNTAQGNALFYGSMTYDSQGNVYFYGTDSGLTGTPTNLVYYKWDRGSGVLGSKVVLDALQIDVGGRVSAKRGHLGSKAEWTYTHGASAPFSVKYDRIVLNLAPTAPTLIAPADNASVPRSGDINFQWQHNDPDGDAQVAYAIRRRRLV